MDIFNNISLSRFAATVCAANNIEPPKQAAEGLEAVADKFSSPERTVIFNPDAIGQRLYQCYFEKFAPLVKYSSCAVPFASPMPTVTPVCFATMYTGTLPEIHGIKRYEKPVVTTDSLFDAFVRAGKRVALVAVDRSSMATIFTGKQIDYFLTPYDGEAVEKAEELIAADEYDLVSVYTQGYDDTMHRTGPESEESLAELDRQIAYYDRIAKACVQTGRKTLLTFSPDHGIHKTDDGRGAHGLLIPEDVNTLHFFGMLN